jgi:hypothetical protein
MEQVSIHLRPDVARALQRQGPAVPASEEILREASRLGVSLEPVHPGTSAPELMTHFSAYVEDPDTARTVVETLQRNDAVDGAYVTPPAAPAAPPTDLP